MRVCIGLIASTVGLLACRGDSNVVAPSPKAVVTTTVPIAAPVADASSPTIAIADAGGKPLPDVDLLHFTPAAVAVSSNVKNPRDYPEHLIDNKPETAWNSATGQTVGSRIVFRVPKDARVKRLDISAGFDKNTPAKGDFFTMNHRITKIRVFRRVIGENEAWFAPSEHDKVQKGLIGTFTLDPKERRPQPFSLGDQEGGIFIIVVDEILPGTKKGWDELTISELHVMGQPGATRFPEPRMPIVTIGDYVSSTDQPTFREKTLPANVRDPLSELPLLTHSTVDVCTRWDKVVTPVFNALYSEGEYPGPPDKPYCKPAAEIIKVTPASTPPPTTTAASNAINIKTVRMVTLDTVYQKEDHLLVETDKGAAIPKNAVLGFKSTTYDMRKTELKIKRARMEESELVVSVEEIGIFEFYCGAGDNSGPTRSNRSELEFDLRCTGFRDLKPTCVRVVRRDQCRGDCGNGYNTEMQ